MRIALLQGPVQWFIALAFTGYAYSTELNWRLVENRDTICNELNLVINRKGNRPPSLGWESHFINFSNSRISGLAFNHIYSIDPTIKSHLGNALRTDEHLQLVDLDNLMVSNVNLPLISYPQDDRQFIEAAVYRAHIRNRDYPIYIFETSTGVSLVDAGLPFTQREIVVFDGIIYTIDIGWSLSAQKIRWFFNDRPPYNQIITDTACVFNVKSR